MSKLSIIITHHNEPIELIKPLFQSLDLQVAFNWNDVDIIVCDDTGKFFDYSFINDLNNIKDKIKYLNDSSCHGAGFNRQQGMDFCDSEYFMFCDCDDRLYSCTSIRNVLNAINRYPDADIIQYNTCISSDDNFEEHSVFLDNLVGGGSWGTVLKKEFYIRNDIKNIDVPIDEDMYINKIIRCINTKKVVSIPDTIYTWCRRNNSLSHLCSIESATERYIVQTESKLKIIKNIYNYCINHKDVTTFDKKLELWNEIPYFYWIQQGYENDVGLEKIDKTIEQELNSKIVDLYRSIVDDDFFYKYLYEQQYVNLSTIGKLETLQDWVKRIFNIKI